MKTLPPGYVQVGRYTVHVATVRLFTENIHRFVKFSEQLRAWEDVSDEEMRRERSAMSDADKRGLIMTIVEMRLMTPFIERAVDSSRERPFSIGR